MANSIYDIQSQGMAKYNELQKINNDVQDDIDFDVDIQNPIDPPKNIDYTSKEFLDQQRQKILQRGEYFKNMSIGDRLNLFGIEGGDMSEYFNASSKSRFDDRMTDYRQGLEAEDWRGENQTGIQQLASGIGKMAVIAGTTAADSIIGTIAGIANIVSEAVQGNISREHWLSETINAGVENPVSKYLIGINDKAEEWMPNYYTEEERNSPWYQQFWHANFIGDHFLKNTGFMLGAMLAGKVTTGALSNLTKLGEARNLFKNTAMVVGLEDKTAKEVLAAYKSGSKIGSVERVSKALAEAAKNARTAEIELKLISSAAGSFGESRMEAITNSNDWFEKTKNTLEQKRSEQLQGIEDEILAEHPEIFVDQPIYDKYGNLVGYTKQIANEYAFNNEYNRKKDAIEQKYNNSLMEASKYRVDYSNASFLINFGLTWAENMQLFGDALIGSYSKRSLFNNKVRMASPYTKKIWEDNTAQFVKDIAKGVKSPIFEGTQEMFQQGTTLALNRRAGSKINSFYGDVIDRDGLEVGINYLDNFMKSIEDTYSDAEQWENFAMGFLTALLPIPMKQIVTSTQTSQQDVEQGNNKPKTKIVLGGELYESIREAKKNRTEARALADALNNLEQDDRKKQMLYDVIRYNKSNERQQQALDRGDEKEYKDEEALKIATMIMTYSDAGQIDYLKQLVDEIYTVETKEQVDAIRRNTIYKQKQGDEYVEMSVFDDMSDQEIIDYFKDQKEKMLGKIENGKKKLGEVDKYVNLYQNINKVYGDFGMDENADAYRKQLAFDIMQIDDRELRIKDMSGELMQVLTDYVNGLKETASRRGINEKEIAEIDEMMKDIKDINDLKTAFEDNGVIQKAESIAYENLRKANDEFNKAVEKYKQFIESDEGKEYATLRGMRQILEKEGAQLTKEQEEFFNKMDKIFQKKYKKPLDRIKKHLDKIDSAKRVAGNIFKKVNDLEKLLADREKLYIKLDLLSNQNDYNGIFENTLSSEIFDAIKKFEKFNQEKLYDEYKHSGRIDSFGFGLDNIAEIAKERGDEHEYQSLKQINDYMSLFDDGTINLNNINARRVYNGVVSRLTDNKDLSVEDKEKLVNDYLNEDSGDPNVNAVKEIIRGKLNIKKEAEKKSKDAQNAVKHESATKSESDEDRSWREFFMKTKAEFDEYLDGFNDVDSLIKDLKDAEIMNTRRFKSNIGDVDGLDLEQLKNNLRIERSDFMEEHDIDENNNVVEQKKDDDDNEPENETPENNPKPQTTSTGKQKDPSVESGGVVSGYGSVYQADNPEQNDDQENAGTIVSGEIGGIIDIPDKDAKELADRHNVEKEVVKSGNSQSLPFDTDTDALDVMRYGGNYEISELKKNRETEYKPSDEGKFHNVYNVYHDLIVDAKCQEFLNDGLLASVINYFNATNQKDRAVIRFVYVGDDKALGKFSRHVYAKHQVPMAAVELTEDDIQNIIRNERDEDRRRVLQERFQEHSKLYEFNGRQGLKTFQLLGPVTPQWFSDNKGNAKFTVKEKGIDSEYTYMDFKDQMHREFMKEFVNDVEYNIEGGKTDLNGGENNGGYWKYTNFTSPVEYIYTGRLIKSRKRRSLKDLIKKEKIDSDKAEGNLQVKILFDHRSVSFGKQLGGQEVPLNENFYNDFAKKNGFSRNGSVWIMTKEADGKVYHKGATVLYFNRDWYKNNGSDESNFYARRIKELLTSLVKNHNDANTLAAFKQLHQFFYIDEGHQFRVSNGKFYVGTGNVDFVDLDGEGGVENKVDAMLDLIFRKNESGYRFSLCRPGLTLKQIIDSNIIETDLERLNNIGSSFAISKLQKQNKGFFQPVQSTVFERIRQAEEYHTGRKGPQQERRTIKIHLGKQELTVNERGGKREYLIDGKPVDKGDELYYESLYDTFQEVGDEKSGRAQAYDYSFDYKGRNQKKMKLPSLAVYMFQVGTSDDSKFGLVYSRQQDNTHYELSIGEVNMLKKFRQVGAQKLSNDEAKAIENIYQKVGRPTPKSISEKLSGVKTTGQESKKGENKTIEQTDNAEREKFLNDRYGDGYPKIGDTITIAEIPVGEDGKKDLSNIEYIDGKIIEYSKTNGLVVQRNDGGKTYITLDETDLFYGKSIKQPSGIAKYKQYRHIGKIGQADSKFLEDAEFEKPTQQIQPKREDEPKKQKTKRNEEPSKSDKNNNGKGAVNFGNTSRRGRGSSGNTGSLESSGPTYEDSDGVISSSQINDVVGSILKIAQNGGREKIVQMLERNGVDKSKFRDILPQLMLNARKDAKEVFVKTFFDNKNKLNDDSRLQAIENLIKCHQK